MTFTRAMWDVFVLLLFFGILLFILALIGDVIKELDKRVDKYPMIKAIVICLIVFLMCSFSYWVVYQ